MRKLFLTFAFLLACESGIPAAAPTPTPDIRPAQTAVAIRNSPTPPTATAAPRAPTAIPPTSTPTSTPAPTATPLPTATPEPTKAPRWIMPNTPTPEATVIPLNQFIASLPTTMPVGGPKYAPFPTPTVPCMEPGTLTGKGDYHGCVILEKGVWEVELQVSCAAAECVDSPIVLRLGSLGGVHEFGFGEYGNNVTLTENFTVGEEEHLPPGMTLLDILVVDEWTVEFRKR